MVTFWGEGPRPPQEVWSDYVNPSTWPRWAPHVRSARGLNPLHAGATGTVRGPLGASVRARILTVDSGGMRWAWSVGLGPVVVRMDHWVEPVEHGSRALVTIHGPRAIFRLYRPLATTALTNLCTVSDRRRS